MNRYRLGILLAVITGFWITGCGPKPPEAPNEVGTAESFVPIDEPDRVVARTRLGSISAQSVDEYILALPPNQRLDPKVDRREWNESMIRRVAAETLLVDAARAGGAHLEAPFKAISRGVERRVVSDAYFDSLPRGPNIREEELRDTYEKNLADYQREETRRISHIFLRTGSDRDRDAVRARLEDLREQVLAGENFEFLAREYSESETRHDGGLLGEVPQGRFTEDFDRVVFSLPERVPSEPVLTTDGGHIFFVHDIFEAREFSFDTVREALQRELLRRRRYEALRELAASLPKPGLISEATPEDLLQISRRGDLSAVLLRVGDFTLKLGQFLEMLQTQQRLLGPIQVPDLPHLLLQEIRDREIIYQHMADSGIDPAVSRRIESEQNRELAKYYAEEMMRSSVEQKTETIQNHYDNNKMRFASPLKLHLRRLSIPFSGDPSDLMGDLEGAIPSLNSGQLTLNELERRHGGQLQDLGMIPASQIQRATPRVLRLVLPLADGQCAPPYSVDQSIQIVQLVERQEPGPQPLALVRDRVIEDYLQHHSAEAFRELSVQILAEGQFKLVGTL